MTRLDEIKDRLNKATPGLWAWRLNPKAKDLMLISNASMMPIIMTFWRYGFNSAIAVFRDFQHDILEKADKWGVKREPHHDYNLDINHPDAQLIAHASDDMRYLIDTIEAQQQELEELKQDRINYQDQWSEACDGILESWMEIEHLKSQYSAMRESLEQAKDILKRIDECGGEWEAGTACEGIEIIDNALNQSNNYTTTDSTQKDNQDDKLCPQEIYKPENENKQLNDGDELATLEEAKKIKNICKWFDGWSCEIFQDDKICPKMCPKWEGNGR